MKYPRSWLNEFVDISISTEELADKLSLAGLEVESIDKIGATLCNIVTCEIKKIDKHPDADKLSVTHVTDGKETHQIVCGASNIHEGAKVPVSLPGAVLPGGFKIKKAKLRGVESNGMICSESELGVADKSNGIWLLPNDTPVGEDFVQYAQLKDDVLEIGILPNRGDCQSIYGLAREISTLLGVPLKSPDTSFNTTPDDTKIQIQSHNSTLCPLYIGRIIKQAHNDTSPLWLQRRLQLCGIRPISLLVDITNYVLLELGQPLHAFDFAKLSGDTLHIQEAKDGSKIVTLDGENRTIHDGSLVIADASGPIALAGVMGGKGTEVDDTSSAIFLESAYFDAISTRKSASKHGIRTDSAIRFEKGVDCETVITANNRACHLYQTLAGATIAEPLHQFRDESHGHFSKKVLSFDESDINTLLGTSIKKGRMISILESLGFECNGKHISVPSWRTHDINEMPCIAEEVARIYGYEHIESTVATSPGIVKEESLDHIHHEQALTFLVNHGFSETCTFPMVSPKSVDLLKLENSHQHRLSNPLSENESTMRQHMLQSLLPVLHFNLQRQQHTLQLCEIGRVYKGDEKAPDEQHMLTAICTGSRYVTPYTSHDHGAKNTAFFPLKGLVEALAYQLDIHNVSFSKSDLPYLHPVKQLHIQSGDTVIGEIGVIHPQTLKQFDISEEVATFSIHLDKLRTLETPKMRYSPISKFPSTRRDIAIVAPKTLPYSELKSLIDAHKSDMVVDVFPFDVFESDKLGPDEKSIAIGFIYQSDTGTLEDTVVNDAHNALSNIITSKLNVRIR